MGDEADKDVISRIKGGDKDAYAVLVNRYKNAIFNLALRMTGDYHLANDLAQEVFIRAYEKLSLFNPDKGFLTWLYTIGLNHIRNRLKKEQRSHLAGEGLSDTEGVLPVADSLDDEICKLEASLMNLPPELREAVVFRYYQQLSFEEVSRVLGISLSATKMRVYRALARLRVMLKD